MLETRFDKTWIDAIGEDKLLKLLQDVNSKVKESRESQDVLPKPGDPLMFQAFRSTPYNEVKMVWLAQEPYHEGTFNGLAFGNGKPFGDMPKKISSPLLNIQRELYRTHGDKTGMDLSLYYWASQGVLLLNTAHTVVKGLPSSHLEIWKEFTAEVIEAVNKLDKVIWVLLGTHAAKYKIFSTNKNHIVLEFGHPSPLNRGNPFLGSGCFLKCDEVMDEPINWTLPF